MKKRWIGPLNPDPETGVEDAGHDVVLAGRQLGTVKHGEVLEVPDDLWDELTAASKAKGGSPLPVWPESLWEDVADARPAKREKGDAGQ